MPYSSLLFSSFMNNDLVPSHHPVGTTESLVVIFIMDFHQAPCGFWCFKYLNNCSFILFDDQIIPSLTRGRSFTLVPQSFRHNYSGLCQFAH